MQELKGTKFAFLSHETEGLTGYPEILGNYLREGGVRLAHIRFPFHVSQTKSIWIEHYDGKKLLSRKRSWIRFYRPQILSFVKDFLWVMLWGWKEVRGADFVVATNNLMGFAALLLRKMGIIKRFTYMMIDYSPRRFSNPVIERIYVMLDRLVTVNADSVWPIAYSMLDGRVQAGRVRADQVKKVFECPMGTYSDIVFANGVPAFDKRDLVFVGNPRATNVRADFLIELARHLKSKGEKFRLIFVGPGETAHLKKMADDLGVGDCVVFRGSIPDLVDLERFLAACGMGLAPYDPYLKDNFSKFADPGKIKNYLGCGLPVISTTVPPIAQELQDTGAGVIADMTVEDYGAKIMALWRDDVAYTRARKESRRLGERYTWPSIFDRLMTQEGFAAVRATRTHQDKSAVGGLS